jgi:hypothetical protein
MALAAARLNAILTLSADAAWKAIVEEDRLTARRART